MNDETGQNTGSERWLRKAMDEIQTRPNARPISTPAIDTWVPPVINKDDFRSAFGSSVVEEFVKGHRPIDVIRELVQNEFDAEGHRLNVLFGVDGVRISGTGKPIDRAGWSRLSLLLGTGKVVGNDSADTVAPKQNGIGSKNFGLRSLFLFGDRIHVRSRGRMAVLDLPALGTQNIPEQASRDDSGVQIFVPYRTVKYGDVEVFSEQDESAAFDEISRHLPDTLLKLMVPGTKKGVRSVVITSERTGRTLVWNQHARAGRTSNNKIRLIRRTAALKDIRDDKLVSLLRLAELEFQVILPIPSEYRDTKFPSYFRAPGSRLRIGVSVPIRGASIDLDKPGRFYYPLGITAGLTGSHVSVNAPFEMNEDRSALHASSFNRWLVDRAAELVGALLVSNWLDRFGADAYLAVADHGHSNPDWLARKLNDHLQDCDCWPMRSAAGHKNPFARADALVVPEAPWLDGFLDHRVYLDSRLAKSKEATALFLKFGGRRFTTNSLVRLRCGPKESTIQTVLSQQEANYYFTDFQDALGDAGRQQKMTDALSKSRLSKANRDDLRQSTSTLAADGSLNAASNLFMVDKSLWDVCPIPATDRLHPDLVGKNVIARLCRPYIIDEWLRGLSTRARSGSASEQERSACYSYILAHGEELSRSVLKEIRRSPLVRDHRGQWTAPESLISRSTPEFELLEPVLRAPAIELEAASGLLRRLRIRQKLRAADFVSFAKTIKDIVAAAHCERTLIRFRRVLDATAVNQLQSIPFLRSEVGLLATPKQLHVSNRLNRACLDAEDGFVTGSNLAFYRQVGCLERPTSSTLLIALSRWRSKGTPPQNPETFYATLVEALRAEGIPPNKQSAAPILWVSGSYRTPDETLVGQHFPPCFLAAAVPQLREPERLCRAYEALGAARNPRPRNWRDLFVWFGTRANQTVPLSAWEHRALLIAYSFRGSAGLPEGVAETTRCLLTQDGTLCSVALVKAGRYVENDYPDLAEELRSVKADIAFALVTDASSAFVRALGIRTLSSVSEPVRLITGEQQPSPPWFRADRRQSILSRLGDEIFRAAMIELARSFSRDHASMRPPVESTVKQQLGGITQIRFLREMWRVYRVSETEVQVRAEAAIQDGALLLITPRSSGDLDVLLASSLAELLGAIRVEDLRLFSALIFPYLCLGRTDGAAYLRRQGIELSTSRTDHLIDGTGDSSSLTIDEEDLPFPEVVVRELVSTLAQPGSNGTEKSELRGTQAQPAPPVPPSPPIAQNRRSVVLPPLSEVRLAVAQMVGTPNLAGATSSDRTDHARAGHWSPPSPNDTERDRKVGERGEELVYRLQLERLRALGYARPEEVVIWISQTDPGADHDIKSVSDDGVPIWIEVKSTTGLDGCFYWPKSEFELALRERERYELWRVYEAHTGRPTAKCFRNPVALIQTSALRLDLGTLRATIEPLRC